MSIKNDPFRWNERFFAYKEALFEHNFAERFRKRSSQRVFAELSRRGPLPRSGSSQNSLA